LQTLFFFRGGFAIKDKEGDNVMFSKRFDPSFNKGEQAFGFAKELVQINADVNGNCLSCQVRKREGG
jgi:phosphoribosyl-AMP cyclohydrolase